MTKSTLKSALKFEAHKLGFQLVGVTTPDPPAHLAVYEQWLAAGRHAGMGWMGTARNRQRRADPKLILPECKSILVLGIAYPPPPQVPPSGGEGRIASYAWGDDYHDVLPERLQAIVTFIETQVGNTIPNRWYTDTGPILEREMAQRAGLGWIGKNTCLINPQAGSYFLLAEILLGIELPPDEPLTIDQCGTCTRCIEACPTQCILPDRTIDANHCISYLTIEEKGPLPLDLRPKIGNWVFGCDVCQQVCPWNQRFAAPSLEARFAAQPDRIYSSLKDELALTPQAFNRKFKGSPVKRTKRRGYLRNVAVVLGNTGHPDGIQALKQAIDDPDPLIRGHAAWALGIIGDEKAGQTLEQALKSEFDAAVGVEIQTALAKIQASKAKKTNRPSKTSTTK
jgi:epoxyqueuosine reductase